MFFRAFFLVVAGLFFAGSFSHAQTGDSLKVMLRSLHALKITTPIKIDGVLDESEWTKGEKAGDFIQTFPNPGNKSRQPTSVVTLYDNTALYFGAILSDISRDSIICTLSERDQNDNADMFIVTLDTYNDDQNAFNFAVTSAGVQVDSRESANGEDVAWNGVWYSAVKLTNEGWYVEMKIPFSAIRFSEKPNQVWGLNFGRNIRRYREDSYWNTVNPLINGYVNQCGNLEGLENIKSPLRLSLTPYVSGYYNRYDDKAGNVHDDSFDANGGMDLKYGINEAFTLDMTLIPDFGQVQSDNRILNTTPFEVRYNEFRQFFTEGTEIYNKSGLFYSRRIGSTPINFTKPYYELQPGEEIISNPGTSKLLNATKITGRTKSGTGIGVFNAITQPMYARLKDTLGGERKIETDPLTNYNVFVLDQNLKNNSFVNLTNTNVMRSGSTYDANCTSLSAQLNTKENKFGFDLGGRLSQQFDLYANEDVTLGYTAFVGAYKKYGNFTFGGTYSEESDTYDPNDLGYLQNNNSRVFSGNYSYRTFQPKGVFLRKWYEGSVTYAKLYNPNVFNELTIYQEIGATTKNWLAYGIWFYGSPTKTYDYFEPRVPGRFYKMPEYIAGSGFISTDYRKKFAFDFRPEIIKFNYKDWIEYSVFVSPRFRVNDKFSMILSASYNAQYGDQGSALTADGVPTIINDTIVYSIRNRYTWENIISAKYIFTNKMALTLRVRHYWGKLVYNSFHELKHDGTLGPHAYSGVNGDGNSYHNTSLNIFNIDMVYTWVFAPGSELRFVWKNSIFDYTQKVFVNYGEDFKLTMNAPQNNGLSIKLIYYLDVLAFKKKV